MRRAFLLQLLFMLLSLLVSHRQAGAEPKLLAFTHVSVIDATGSPAKPDMTVVITGNRISAIGQTGKVDLPKEMQVIDATGKFLIPGLWDMHVHWYEKDYLPLFIANGVTGVRQMWGFPLHHQWRKEMANGALLGPRIVIASTIVDGPKPIWPGSMAVSNKAEAVEAVTKAKQDGADFIKVYSLLPREAFFAIADEVKKQGLSFAGHVPDAVSAAEASDAGQKSIEHLTGILISCSTREQDLRKKRAEAFANRSPDQRLPSPKLTRPLNQMMLETFSPEKAESLFARFKKNKTFHCPTFTVLRSGAFLDDTNLTRDSRLKYMPLRIRAMWDPKNDFRFKERTAEDFALAKKIFQKQLEIAGRMHRAGVPLLAGTDVLNPYCFPGFSLHDELGLLVQAGLTPMEALQTATRNPAEYLGALDSLGTVENGKIADLVLLDANPLEDIGNTKKIAAVVVGGKLLDKTRLEEMLAQVEKIANKKSIAEALLKTITEQNVQKAIQLYHELKAKEFDAYDFSESGLNFLGYQLLEAKKLNEAIEIFKLNVENFPQSSNGYDSLAEAYMKNGDKELAIKNYKKSLELDPKNTNAVEMLKKLGAN